ncbi:hypothetical protein [Aquimarina sp. 2304DJ70-9]|uniref:hypothetical protein n=1 Tax=Aquimarina penaris TaxID=3231044 RepID=UPI00346255DE
MKNYNVISMLAVIILIAACQEKKCPELPKGEFEIQGHNYIIDTLKVQNVDSLAFEEKILLDETFINTYKNLDLSANFIKSDTEAITTTCGAIPTNMAELTGGLKKYFYKFTSSTTVNLDALGYGGGSLGKKEMLLMIDFVQHKEVQCDDGKSRKYGVGSRLFLHITKKKRGVNLTLPQLAANVELNRAEVAYTISTIGIVGPSVIDALPTGSNFDVENYAKVVNAVDNIIRLAKDNEEGVVVTPQLLPSKN